MDLSKVPSESGAAAAAKPSPGSRPPCAALPPHFTTRLCLFLDLECQIEQIWSQFNLNRPWIDFVKEVSQRKESCPR